MTRTIASNAARQSFSNRIRSVEAGDNFVITRNGRTVANLPPVANARVPSEQQKQALALFREVAGEGWVLNAGPLDRDGCMSVDRGDHGQPPDEWSNAWWQTCL